MHLFSRVVVGADPYFLGWGDFKKTKAERLRLKS